MAADLTTNFTELLGARVRLPRRVEELRGAYETPTPFPHVVMDGLFPERLLDSMLDEIRIMQAGVWNVIDQDTREQTVRMRSAADMGPAGIEFLSIVHSAAFLYLLSEVTGIRNLLPDPYLKGAGYALMRRGDFFHVHADRNVAYDTGLTRRLAMIVFLNKDWPAEFHGELELWSSDGKRCDRSIPPLFNRTALFEVAFPNYHGVPAPLACPTDRARQSFIIYYHTVQTATAEAPHTTVFAPRFYGTNRLTVRSMIRDIMPPVLTRSLRKIGKSKP